MVNNNRRNITKNQQAMLYAVAYPTKQQGKARTCSDSNKLEEELNRGRIAEARLAIEYASEFVDDVIAGAMSLNAAYKTAQARRDEKASYARRLLLS